MNEKELLDEIVMLEQKIAILESEHLQCNYEVRIPREDLDVDYLEKAKREIEAKFLHFLMSEGHIKITATQDPLEQVTKIRGTICLKPKVYQ